MKYTIQYAGAYSFYWLAYCSSASFISVYLLSKHFANSQIGIVLAASYIVAVFLQPAVAAFADRVKRFTVKGLMTVLGGAAALLALARFFVAGLPVLLAVLLILEFSVLFTLQPLMNSLGMQLYNNGIEINFGLARGCASLAFAVFSVLFGLIVDRFGVNFIPVVTFVLYLGFVGVIHAFKKEALALPEEAEGQALEPQAAPGQGTSQGLLAFFAQNKPFTYLLAAVSFTFCAHAIVNNYLAQIAENVGGTVTDMGIAFGLAAAIELPAMALFSTLVKKVRCSTILQLSLLFFLLKTAVTMLAVNVFTIYAAQLFQFGAYALFIPASVYYTNAIIQKKDLAKGQAFMTTAITVGGVSASFVGGWLLDHSTVRNMLIFATIATVLGLIIGFYAIEKQKRKEHAQERQLLG